MTPSLSALAIRRARRARIIRRAFPLALGLVLGLSAAAHARSTARAHHDARTASAAP